MALLALVLGVTSNTFAQDSSPKIWLPVRHSESLKNDLDTVIVHAASRAACITIIEAKLSDSSAIDNAKFIITCESDTYGTQNLVYWRRDVRENFVNVAYLSKEEALARQAQNEDGTPLMPESDKIMLIDHCKTALRETLDGNLPPMSEGDVHFRQRGENRFVIFMDYSNDSAILELNYTATCITDREANISLNVFPH
ncbi:MAG: hypothetical protein GKR91_00185 [Pseudomonadales bacterium]|nr:hypothetical protein [Pseudomonadales bacterium]